MNRYFYDRAAYYFALEDYDLDTERENTTMTQRELPKYLWLQEFSADYDVPREILDLVDGGTLADVSWHNDTCPSFEIAGAESDLALYCQHPDPQSREVGGERFIVLERAADSFELEREFSTDDVAQALRTLQEWGQIRG